MCLGSEGAHGGRESGDPRFHAEGRLPSRQLQSLCFMQRLAFSIFALILLAVFASRGEDDSAWRQSFGFALHRGARRTVEVDPNDCDFARFSPDGKLLL